MAPKTIQGSETLARQIKSRRNELGLTIEEAASRAGVGTKTWCRYEAGQSIRSDKYRKICKVLNWHSLPGQEKEDAADISVQEYRNHEAWSPFLEATFGVHAAMSFALGSDILLDYIEEDLAELASLPAGSHIGQLDMSWLDGSLPAQFLMHYDYDFLYRMKCVLQTMRMRTKNGLPFVAHSVMDELIIYLCTNAAADLVKLHDETDGLDEETYEDPEEWVFDLFGDMDIITCLYSDWYLDPGHSYHFSHWNEPQFWMEPDDSPDTVLSPEKEGKPV